MRSTTRLTIMLRRLLLIHLLLFSFVRLAVAESIGVIVNPELGSTISKEDIARIYLGKQSQLADGTSIIPLDIDSGHPAYTQFSRQVLNKTPTQLRAYWARQIFSGGSRPPKSVNNQQQLIKMVRSDKQCIAYVTNPETLPLNGLRIVTFSTAEKKAASQGR